MCHIAMFKVADGMKNVSQLLLSGEFLLDDVGISRVTTKVCPQRRQKRDREMSAEDSV